MTRLTLDPARRTRLGIIYPGPPCAVSEYDQYARSAVEPVHIDVASTEAHDTHLIPDLRYAGSTDKLVRAAHQLNLNAPAVIAWACTSASFVFGAAGALEQVAAIQAATGRPATSTSLAFVAGLRGLGIERVAVLGPYPREVTQLFETFLGDYSIEVTSTTSLGSPGGTASARMGLDVFGAALASLELHRSDCVLLPDTAAFGLTLAGPLSEMAGQPVLAANQVTLWHATRLAGQTGHEPLFGALPDTLPLT